MIGGQGNLAGVLWGYLGWVSLMKCVWEIPREYLEELGGECHSELQHSIFLTPF